MSATLEDLIARRAKIEDHIDRMIEAKERIFCQSTDGMLAARIAFADLEHAEVEEQIQAIIASESSNA